MKKEKGQVGPPADPKVGLFLTPDKAGQFANGYVYGNNSPVMAIDKDGNFAFFAFLELALKIYYVGSNTVKGAEQGGFWGALKNYWISSATVQLAGAASKALKPATAVGSLAASNAAYSAGNVAMYGGDFSVSAGFGSYNFSKGSWKWADYSGDFLSDVSTTFGYMALSEDYSKVMDKVDRAVWGDPKPQNGGPNYQDVKAKTAGTKFGRYDANLKTPIGQKMNWPWYKHVNPADIVTHGIVRGGDWLLSKLHLSDHGSDQSRYPGGIHWGSEKLGQYHFDHIDAVYGVNIIGHNLFEAAFPGLISKVSDPLRYLYVDASWYLYNNYDSVRGMYVF